MNTSTPRQDTGQAFTPTDNTFIGRESEVAEIQALLAQKACRLLTLVGPGGIGKTRLALQVGARISANFARGHHIVYLQPLRSAEFFTSAVADGLGISLTGQEPPLVQLSRYLSNKETLLIIDNFEHLLDASDELLTLIAATPGVKYLVTSREALNVREEWLYLVRGMAFPGELSQATGYHGYDAVHLFNERARRVYSGFSPETEAEDIVRICRLVGGMPLALELAAAWRKTLRCREIADEIERGLEFLTTRLRDVSDRHHSIQTVFDQTWQRLTPQEQGVFKQLSVFQGGFQREAACVVAGATLPVLSTLDDKSLLRLDANGRYQIHELLRQYAAGKLDENQVDAQRAHEDHTAYFVNFLDECRPHVIGGNQHEALLAIRRELGNIRIAWLWAVTHHDADAIRRASESLGLYYQFQGGYLEGMTLFSQATAMLKTQPVREAVDMALLGTRMYEGWYNLRFGRLEETEACMVDSVAIYGRLNIPPLDGYLTDPNAPLSFVALTRGDYAAAIRFAEHVRRVAETHQQPINRQFAYHLLSTAHLGRGEFEIAQTFAQQAYAQSVATGDSWFRAYILNNLGQIAVALDDNRMGQAHFQDSYNIRQAFDDPEGMALALVNLGNLAVKERALDEAKAHYQRSQAIYQEINDKGGLASADWGLGRVFRERGAYALTQGYFRQALQLASEIDYRPVLFGLLVDIADLLWRMGQRERPLVLLAYTIHNPLTDHETRHKARSLLSDVYERQVSADVLATAIAKSRSSNMDRLTADLLHQLSLPPASSPEASSPPTTPAPALVEPLTPRELEVLSLLCEAHTNREIAVELGIATGTVKYYTGQIYGKLGVRNRVSAVARAHELYLVT